MAATRALAPPPLLLPRRRLLLLLLLLAAALALCAAPARACAPPNAKDLTIGESTYVCLVVNNERFTLAQPRADHYMRFTVKNTYERNRQGVGCKEDLYHVETLGVRSAFRKRYCNTDGFYFPILTAIVAVEDGKVSNVTWDDGCYFTGKNFPTNLQECKPNAYSVSSVESLSSVPPPAEGKDTALTTMACNTESNTFCDLQVYVAWTGTDSNGNYFGSSGRRFSVFENYALQPEYPAMRLFLNDDKPSVF